MTDRNVLRASVYVDVIWEYQLKIAVVSVVQPNVVNENRALAFDQNVCSFWNVDEWPRRFQAAVPIESSVVTVPETLPEIDSHWISQHLKHFARSRILRNHCPNFIDS